MTVGQAPELWFYHLLHWPLERALPVLLEKSLERGWRAIIRSGTPERLDALDGHLWTYRDDSFLAHGIADGKHDAGQPVLLTTSLDNPNDAQVLFVIDHAEVGDLTGYARCILVFDGRDEDAVAAARAEWTRGSEAGYAVSYWQQGEQGGFEKKA